MDTGGILKNLKVFWDILAVFIAYKIWHPPPIKLFQRSWTIHITSPDGVGATASFIPWLRHYEYRIQHSDIVSVRNKFQPNISTLTKLYINIFNF